jgi:hypothetical protein
VARRGAASPGPAAHRRFACLTVFDWSDSLVLAQRLAQETNDEAARSAAISRAYYAASCTARDRLVAHGCPVSRRGAHAQVWAAYRNSAQKDCRKIGEWGFNLRDRRNRADYDATLMFRLVSEVHVALRFASNILSGLARLSPAERCC